jgi:hypothetical protein
MSSNYPSYSPPDQNNSNTSQSPWSASSHTRSGHESLTLAPINPDRDLNFDDNDQYCNSLPRIQPLNHYPPEPSNSYEQEQQPPPSNQQARQEQTSRTYSRYQVSESPDPFDDFIVQDFEWQDSPRPQRTVRSTRASSVVDLTESSPPPDNMAPSLRKRKASSPSVVGTSKRARPSTTPVKSLRSTPASRQKVEKADMVDLVDIENEDEYKEFRLKQQAEAIKQQQQEESKRPVKLAEVECIICMDRPTDLTVTHCGMFSCCMLLGVKILT